MWHPSVLNCWYKLMLKPLERRELYPWPIETQLTFSGNCLKATYIILLIVSNDVSLCWRTSHKVPLACPCKYFYCIFFPYPPCLFKEKEPFMSVVAKKMPEKNILSWQCHFLAFYATSGYIRHFRLCGVNLGVKQLLKIWNLDHVIQDDKLHSMDLFRHSIV